MYQINKEKLFIWLSTPSFLTNSPNKTQLIHLDNCVIAQEYLGSAFSNDLIQNLVLCVKQKSKINHVQLITNIWKCVDLAFS